MTDATTVSLKDGAKLTESEIVIDSLGRKITIRELDILAESRLIRACGEHASNANYVLGYVVPACMVAEIDGVRLPIPTTALQIEGAIKVAGREGLAAVMNRIESQAKERAEANGSDIKK